MKQIGVFICAVLLSCGLGCSDKNQKPDEDVSSVGGETTSRTPHVAAVGERCGTIANVQCVEAAFCDIENPRQMTDASGTCKARPSECPDIAQDPMPCGRDGKAYATECHANMSGVDLVDEGSGVTCGE